MWVMSVYLNQIGWKQSLNEWILGGKIIYQRLKQILLRSLGRTLHVERRLQIK